MIFSTSFVKLLLINKTQSCKGHMRKSSLYNIDGKKWRKCITLCESDSFFSFEFILDFCCSILSDRMYFGLSPWSPVSLSLNVRICAQKRLNHHQHLKGKICKSKKYNTFAINERNHPLMAVFPRYFSFLLQFNPIYHIVNFVFMVCLSLRNPKGVPAMHFEKQKYIEQLWQIQM